MASWRRITGAAGVVAGATAAGAGAIVAAERIAVGRLRGRPDPASSEPFGKLRGRPLTVLTGDGVALHAEINGPSAAPVTVVFCHAGSVTVFETTYFGPLLILSANGPWREGQASAKPS